MLLFEKRAKVVIASVNQTGLTVNDKPQIRFNISYTYPIKGSGIYLILGKVVLDFGYAAIEVQKLAKLAVKPDPRSV